MATPVRPYDPDTVALRTKIERHLRRKGWRESKGLWVSPNSGMSHTLTAAIKRQLQAEGYT
jgi:hypothetical protein